MALLWRYHKVKREPKPPVVPVPDTRATAKELEDKAAAELKQAEVDAALAVLLEAEAQEEQNGAKTE